MDSPAIEIERVFAPDDDVRRMVTQLEDELAANYPPEQRHGLSLDAIFQPHVRFFLARRDGDVIGCGGIAFFVEFAELKRMYVVPEARGTGVADAMVERLCAEALESGIELVRLETGTLQHAAIRFYERCGFAPCEAFEPYASMPFESIVTSLFFEKRLVD